MNWNIFIYTAGFNSVQNWLDFSVKTIIRHFYFSPGAGWRGLWWARWWRRPGPGRSGASTPTWGTTTGPPWCSTGSSASPPRESSPPRTGALWWWRKCSECESCGSDYKSLLPSWWAAGVMVCVISNTSTDYIMILYITLHFSFLIQNFSIEISVRNSQDWSPTIPHKDKVWIWSFWCRWLVFNYTA